MSRITSTALAALLLGGALVAPGCGADKPSPPPKAEESRAERLGELRASQLRLGRMIKLSKETLALVIGNERMKLEAGDRADTGKAKELLDEIAGFEAELRKIEDEIAALGEKP